MPCGMDAVRTAQNDVETKQTPNPALWVGMETYGSHSALEG